MKPKPVVVTTICSECGLDWDDHGDNPTTSDCVRLLKVELERRPRPVTYYPNWTYPYSWSLTAGAISNTTPLDYTQGINNTLHDGHSINVTDATPVISSTHTIDPA